MPGVEETAEMRDEIFEISLKLLIIASTIGGKIFDYLKSPNYSKLPPPQGLPLSISSKDATWGLGISKNFCKNFPKKRTQITFLYTINNVLPG